ncbi:unnamed protein product, partial [Ceratitis capitata]
WLLVNTQTKSREYRQTDEQPVCLPVCRTNERTNEHIDLTYAARPTRRTASAGNKPKSLQKARNVHLVLNIFKLHESALA